MKKIYRFIIIAFIAVVSLPLTMLNTEKDVVSEIDNRILADDPITVWNECQESGTEFDLNSALTSYVSDRIGFRNQFILGYAQLYDKVFHEMKHPTYMYGKDGYVFFRMGQNIEYSQFHEDYISMMLQIQEYCDARNVPCYFMFEPSKITVLQQYLPDGVNYNRDWADEMLKRMRDVGINVVDNTEILTSLAADGVTVFNKQYNAGHWNDLGAYYGVNNLLSAMRNDGIAVMENDINDFEVSEKLETSLQASEFPISEKEPVIDTYIDEKENLTVCYDSEVERHSDYRGFSYYVNDEKKDSSRLLMFQGSYMNGMGYKFLPEAFSEYISVHDYQNTINFDYYYNIFKPDVVVVEVAEYACNANYFDMTAMENMHLNLRLDMNGITDKASIEDNGLVIQRGKALSRVMFPQELFQRIVREYTLQDIINAYLLINDEVFDFRASQVEGVAYSCTVDNKKLGENVDFSIVLDDGVKVVQADMPVINNLFEKQEQTKGVSKVKDSIDTYEMTTDVEDNQFSYVLLQIQNTETGELMQPQGQKSAIEDKEGALGVYTHMGDTGDYEVRIRANSNKADEYISCQCHLEKGKTYYYQYKLNEFSERKVTVSNIFWGDTADARVNERIIR